MLPAQDAFTRLIASYGGWIVAGVVGLESTGVPLPGETMLVSAALYAATTGRLGIVTVVVAAIGGAIAGDNVGFWIGREFGYHWLVRRGMIIRLTPRRLKLGQYLFDRHGGKLVFFGRFVAVLRTYAALLAGVNCMSWTRFLFFNSTGAAVWAAAYGFGAYAFGQTVARLAGPISLGLLVAAVGAGIGGFLFVRGHERQLEDRADCALPGPLRP